MAALIPQRPQPLVPTTAQNEATGIVEPDDESLAHYVPVTHIMANRQQPRTDFDEERLQELAASIKQSGLIQPLVVTPTMGDRYELVAGERRLRAARLAGLTEVPVVIRRNLDEATLLELALVENLQRDDLNPIEEAKAYQSMVEQFECTQDEIAEKVGKARVTVTNALRLLQLPKIIQDDVITGRLSAGHARALLGIKDRQEQLTVREQVMQSQLTVRDVEAMAQRRRGATVVGKRRSADDHSELSAQMRFILEEMTRVLGTKLIVKQKTAKAGVLQIEYYSLQDLDRIYRRILG